jgi:hypothetical protein
MVIWTLKRLCCPALDGTVKKFGFDPAKRGAEEQMTRLRSDHPTQSKEVLCSIPVQLVRLVRPQRLGLRTLSEKQGDILAKKMRSAAA